MVRVMSSGTGGIPNMSPSAGRKNRSLRKTKHAFVFVLAVLVVDSRCHAQVDRSGLSGTVTDPEGRVLPETHIRVFQNATQLKHETVSQSNGSYTLPGLPVGVYTISFEHAGFKKVTYLDVEEVIGRTRTLNATLSVSGVEQRIEVAAS